MRRLRRIARFAIACSFFAAVTVGWSQTASIANPEEAGKAWDGAALETILATNDAAAMGKYIGGYYGTAEKRVGRFPSKDVEMPADLEAVITRHFDDLSFQSMSYLFFEGHVQYRQRELFDKFYRALMDPKQAGRFSAVTMLATRQTGIEEPVLAYLKSLPVGSADSATTNNILAVVLFFASRQYAPAYASASEHFSALKATGMASRDLLLLRNNYANRLMFDRMAAFRTKLPDQMARFEIESDLRMFGGYPVEAPLDYKALVASLPNPLGDFSPLVREIVVKRREPAGMDVIMASLDDPGLTQQLLPLVIDLGAVDEWKRARALVEKQHANGTFPETPYRKAVADLDKRIADPNVARSLKAARERELTLQAELAKLHEQRMRALSVRNTDINAFVKTQEEILSRTDALVHAYTDVEGIVGVRRMAELDYVSLGNVVRFTLGQPARALELYRAAARHGSIGLFAIADLQEHELGNKRAAIAAVEDLARAPAPAVPVGEEEIILDRYLHAWATHQLHYLRDGTRFSGPVDAQSCQGVMMLSASFLAYYMGFDEFDLMNLIQEASRSGAGSSDAGAKVVARLKSLPSSGMTLAKTELAIPFLPDSASILSYLARNDSAGFASACLLASAHDPPTSGSTKWADARKEFNEGR